MPIHWHDNDSSATDAHSHANWFRAVTAPAHTRPHHRLPQALSTLPSGWDIRRISEAPAGMPALPDRIFLLPDR